MNNQRAINEEYAYGLFIRQIRAEEHAPVKISDERNGGTFGWVAYRLADWKGRYQLMEEPKGYLNSASICVLSRRMMATEWARALGGEFPQHRALALKRKVNI